MWPEATVGVDWPYCAIWCGFLQSSHDAIVYHLGLIPACDRVKLPRPSLPATTLDHSIHYRSGSTSQMHCLKTCIWRKDVPQRSQNQTRQVLCINWWSIQHYEMQWVVSLWSHSHTRVSMSRANFCESTSVYWWKDMLMYIARLWRHDLWHHSILIDDHHGKIYWKQFWNRYRCSCTQDMDVVHRFLIVIIPASWLSLSQPIDVDLKLLFYHLPVGIIFTV